MIGSIVHLQLYFKLLVRAGLSFVRNDHDSFHISFRRYNQYNPQLIISAISNVIQSNAEFLFDENLSVEVTRIENDFGYGRSYRLEGCTTDSFTKTHKRCLAYALVLGIAHVENNKNEFIRLTYPPNADSFTREALELCNKANVDLSYGGGIEELRQFQNYFQDKYNIIVSKVRKGRSLFFRGHGEDGVSRLKIFLLLEN